MPIYELSGPPSSYEEDHLIPLELGGVLRNPKPLAGTALTGGKVRSTRNEAQAAGVQTGHNARQSSGDDSGVQIQEGQAPRDRARGDFAPCASQTASKCLCG